MGAPYHNLHGKLSKALKAHLATNIGEPINVYSFAEITSPGVKIEEPYIGVRVGRSTPSATEMQLERGIGNRALTIELYCRSHADDVPADGGSPAMNAADAHDDLVGTVMDMFLGCSDIIAQLNVHCEAVKGVRINQMEQPEQSGPDVIGRSYVTILSFPVMAYPVEE